MEYSFYINDIEIEEPLGFADFELSMRRDDKMHGIQFEVSTGTLKFYGEAANYLRAQKESYGIQALVIFRVLQYCDDESGDVTQEITGRLNFGKYKETCGSECTVELPVEEDNCKIIFKNRYDQKVDLDTKVAFDGLSGLADYAALGIDLTLHAKALQSAVDGSVAEEGFEVEVIEPTAAGAAFLTRPNYEVERYNNIQTGQLIAVSNSDNNEGPDFPISPQLLFEDVITCFDGQFEYSGRQKGSFTATATAGTRMAEVKHRLIQWDGVGNIFDDGIILAENILFAPPNFADWPPLPQTYEFDSSLSATIAIPEGVAVYDVLYTNFPAVAGTPTITLTVTYDPETFFTLSAVRACPDTQVEAYLAHETFSRVAEAITNNCVRVKSDYYGRIDSQPFAFSDDGCGGLRMFTSGLKIRRAAPPEDKFFASMKELFEGSQAIDNTGFDIIEDDTLQGAFIMRIEAVEFFYQDQEMFVIDAIPEAVSEVQETMHVAKILVGYRKWEVENVNGLDEFNSTREYRTNLDTISNPLDITSNLVAGSYAIEITRNQSLADSGEADTKFDNDIFVITLRRNAYDFVVEQGNISDAENIFDPETVYNFRLSPVRNLMRWYKTIAAGYPNISSSENKLFFSAGTGNLTATGEVVEGAYDALCKLEAMPLVENQNIFTTHFARTQDYTPLWKNETIAFTYPLNIAEYKAIKANPYGYISYQCGNGAYAKGYIKEVKFKPAKGTATFSLIKKWQS